MDAALEKGPTWTAQFKRLLDDTINVKISDRLIAPKYNHDRMERSILTRLYAMGREEYFLVFSLFAVGFSSLTLVGLAGPPIVSRTARSYSDMRNSSAGSDALLSELANGEVRVSSPLYTPFAQQLWVIAQPKTALIADVRVSSVLGVEIRVVEGYSSADSSSGESILRDEKNTVQLDCEKTFCSSFTLFHLSSVRHIRYEAAVTFVGMKTYVEKFGINDVTFFFKSYNPDYTRFEMWIRFGFVLLTFLVAVFYYRAIFRFGFQYCAMESCWLAILLPALLLFNNPLFPLVFISSSSRVPLLLEELFQTLFLALILLFWLCVYHGIRRSDRDFVVFYLPKMLIVGCMWLSMFSIAAIDRLHDADDAWRPADQTLVNLNFAKTVFYIAASCYVFYLLVLIVRAYTELKNLPNFDLRLKIFTGLMTVVAALTTMLTWRKYGVMSALEDHFAAQLNTTYSSSVDLLVAYSLFNLYIYLMAYVYSPVVSSSADGDLSLKDGAADSLLQESEDELLYDTEFMKTATRINAASSGPDNTEDEDSSGG